MRVPHLFPRNHRGRSLLSTCRTCRESASGTIQQVLACFYNNSCKRWRKKEGRSIPPKIFQPAAVQLALLPICFAHPVFFLHFCFIVPWLFQAEFCFSFLQHLHPSFAVSEPPPLSPSHSFIYSFLNATLFSFFFLLNLFLVRSLTQLSHSWSIPIGLAFTILRVSRGHGPPTVTVACTNGRSLLPQPAGLLHHSQ